MIFAQGYRVFIQEAHSSEWCADEKKACGKGSETFPGIFSDAKPSLFFFLTKVSHRATVKFVTTNIKVVYHSGMKLKWSLL